MNKRLLFSLILLVGLLAVPSVSWAASDCTFTTAGSVMHLDADCTTDETILIPDGMTLDGDGHTITAVDPAGGHFVGAVVANAGTTAHVTRLGVTAESLANVCDAGADRLRGIMFEGASGSIVYSNITGINQGASGCQEGNAIEVRNAPFDGTHPATVSVEIAHNSVEDYQKSGIVVNGDVDASVHQNHIGASATQANLAANALQIGFGAMGTAKHNHIDGNQWCGPSNFVATAVLLFESQDADVSQNNIRGNADVGIYEFGTGSVLVNNKVFDDDSIADCNVNAYDYGIGAWGTDPAVKNNKVRGYDTPFDGVTGGKNKSISGPQPGNVWF